MTAPVLHPLVARAFDSLERAGVHWCLLRDEAGLARLRGDVDLLVCPEDATATGYALARAGSAEVRAFGHGSHRFFAAYDEGEGSWLRLDVVTEVAFGPYQSMLACGARVCLERADEGGGLRLLGPTDRFWALLGHCLLDRGDVPVRHAGPLASLARAAACEGPLARPLEEALPPAWDLERVRASAAKGEWASLLALAPELGARWLRQRPGPAGKRLAAGVALRALRPALTAVAGRGHLVALLGPDGAGKSTLAASLREAWPLQDVRTVYLGLYQGGRRSNPGPIRLAARLAWLGRASLAIGWQRIRGRLVICDRHTWDALLPQAAPEGALAWRRRQLLARAAPRPAVAVLLDAPAELLAARKPEHSVAELEQQRGRYRGLLRQRPEIEVLDASLDEASVVRGVVALLWSHYSGQRRGGRRT